MILAKGAGLQVYFLCWMLDFYSLASEFLLEGESSRHSVPPPARTPLICRCLCQKLDYMSWKIQAPNLSAYNKLKMSVCSYSAHCGAIKWNIRVVPFFRFKQMWPFFFFFRTSANSAWNEIRSQMERRRCRTKTNGGTETEHDRFK